MNKSESSDQLGGAGGKPVVGKRQKVPPWRNLKEQIGCFTVSMVQRNG